MSFIADKIVMDGLTYDDVLLIPAYSEVLPKTVELTTKFSRNIELKVPFVTAAMDTVTEAKMAIAIAREGGIGVIHKNMSIEEQARQVAIVKRAENGMIYDPVTIKRGSTVRDALALMSEYRIGGIPVVDDERYLVGIVTNRDLRFEKDMDKRIDEVMTKENIVTTNQSTDMEAASQILQEHKIEKLPVVDKDGKLVGLITYKDITKAKDKPMACKDAKGRLRVAAGVGVTADTLDRMQALVDAGADAIVIDTAHGHSMYVIEKLKEAKKRFPNIDIVVGNIATGEAGMSALFEPAGIALAILLATVVGFLFEMSAAKKFDILNQVNDDLPVKVIRGGHMLEIPKREIVVGDIVMLNAGDEIPADGILLSAVSVQVNESPLTGEPMATKTTIEADFDKEATYPSNAVMNGSTMLGGYGVMQVTQVGDATEHGKVYTGSQIENNTQTPLDKQLNTLASFITKASYVIAAVIFIARTVIYLTEHPVIDWLLFGSYLLSTAMIAVTVIVVAVPEGLP